VELAELGDLGCAQQYLASMASAMQVAAGAAVCALLEAAAQSHARGGAPPAAAVGVARPTVPLACAQAMPKVPDGLLVCKAAAADLQLRIQAFATVSMLRRGALHAVLITGCPVPRCPGIGQY
jgi:hypothetical protein